MWAECQNHDNYLNFLLMLLLLLMMMLLCVTHYWSNFGFIKSGNQFTSSSIRTQIKYMKINKPPKLCRLKSERHSIYFREEKIAWRITIRIDLHEASFFSSLIINSNGKLWIELPHLMIERRLAPHFVSSMAVVFVSVSVATRHYDNCCIPNMMNSNNRWNTWYILCWWHNRM